MRLLIATSCERLKLGVHPDLGFNIICFCIATKSGVPKRMWATNPSFKNLPFQGCEGNISIKGLELRKKISITYLTSCWRQSTEQIHLHETKLRKFSTASIGNKKKNPTQRLETLETSIARQE